MDGNPVHKFMNDTGVFRKDVAEIICVTPQTVGKYCAHNDSKNRRNVDPGAIAIFDYLIEYKIDLELPAVKQYVKYNSVEFSDAIDGRIKEFITLSGSDKSTVSRWLSGVYNPSSQASKLAFLYNTFGWPHDT